MSSNTDASNNVFFDSSNNVYVVNFDAKNHFTISHWTYRGIERDRNFEIKDKNKRKKNKYAKVWLVLLNNKSFYAWSNIWNLENW